MPESGATTPIKPQHAAVELSDAVRYFDQLPACAWVGADVVQVLYGSISKVTLWRLTRAGKVPSPAKSLGGRLNVWNVGELRASLAKIGGAK